MQYVNLGETTSLKDKVYETLKMDIIMGKFKAGEQLNILELAGAMNISSAPIREALSMLHQDGFVVLNPRKKAVVSQGTAKDSQVVTELRRTLEPYAAKISVGGIPQSEIDRVRAQLEAVLGAPGDMQAYINSDLALHELLHAHAGSPVLSDIMTTLKEQSLRLRYCVENVAEGDQKSGFITTSTKEHLQILDALQEGDPDQVYDCVRRHLDNFIHRSEKGERIPLELNLEEAE